MFRLFTIKFHFYFIAYFRFKFFSSLHISNLCFEAKQSEAKFKSIFSLFFAFNFFASLQFSNFRFKAKQGGNFFTSKEAEFNIFRIISLPNFVLGEKKHFYQCFCFIFVLLRFFCFIFAYFTFIFASDLWCFASQ